MEEWRNGGMEEWSVAKNSASLRLCVTLSFISNNLSNERITTIRVGKMANGNAIYPAVIHTRGTHIYFIAFD